MDYTAQSIQQLLKDVKPYLRTKAIDNGEWFVITGDDGEEYKDSKYYMTDGYGLYIIPTEISKFRTSYEADIMKAKLALKEGKKSAHPLKSRSWKSIQAHIPKVDKTFTLATHFTLDFDAFWGPVALCRDDVMQTTQKVNLNLLHPFEIIAKDFPVYANYEIYIRSGLSPVVVLSEGDVIGVLTPIYKEG